MPDDAAAVFGPYAGAVTAVHDGDTFAVDLDLGFGIHAIEFRCRIFGINAPELRTAAGVAARTYLVMLMPVGSKVSVLSHSWDKYGGRFDGTVLVGDVDIGEAMVLAEHAIRI